MTQNEIIAQLKFYSIAKSITETYGFIPCEDEYSLQNVTEELKHQGIEHDEESVKNIIDKFPGWDYNGISDKVYQLINQL